MNIPLSVYRAHLQTEVCQGAKHQAIALPGAHLGVYSINQIDHCDYLRHHHR
jgi:hypothetical protein